MSVNFFGLLLLRGCVDSLKVKKTKNKKHTVAFCVYIALFLQICSLILWFEAEMKYIMNFLKLLKFQGITKLLLYYCTAHYLLYVIDV